MGLGGIPGKGIPGMPGIGGIPGGIPNPPGMGGIPGIIMPGGGGAGPPTPRTGPARPAGAPPATGATGMPRPAARATPCPGVAVGLGALGMDSICSDTTFSPLSSTRPSRRFSSFSSTAAAGGKQTQGAEG